MNDFNIDELLNSFDESSKGGEKEGIKNGVDKKPISKGKLVACVIVGLIVSFIIFMMVTSIYNKYIRFPAQEEIIYKNTGAYALDTYVDLVHSQKGLGENDYLVKEIAYANSNKVRLAFITKVVNTVQYKPSIVNAKNVYGNDMVDKNTGKIVTIKSPVEEGEEVGTIYIDYSKIVFDEDLLNIKINEYGLTKDNVVYSNVLVDMFCDYIYSLEEIPLKTVNRVPELKCSDNKYSVLPEEDIYFDVELFSSKDFEDCKMRFTEMVGKIVVGEDFKETEEWVSWDSMSKLNKETTIEPLKYGKYSMAPNWCGAYYLQNNCYSVDDNGNPIKEIIKPQLGDGSFESPASISTPVVSYVMSENADGTTKLSPIKVEMVEFGVSEDALTWFQSKHIQNRGFNLESEVQYYYCVFKVTNLSEEVVTVKDNSFLCDKNGNLSTKTGKIFGLNEMVTLNPNEIGYIDSWGRSTELYKKYVIWGADFDKKIDVIWFRVLAGDLEDLSKYKGVHVINQSKLEKS